MTVPDSRGILDKHPALGLLQVAVPLRIEEIRYLPESEYCRLAREAGQYIASHGDDLMFRSRKGASAQAFNQLVTGLAVLAFAPGGVTFAGMRFEADRGRDVIR